MTKASQTNRANSTLHVAGARVWLLVALLALTAACGDEAPTAGPVTSVPSIARSVPNIARPEPNIIVWLVDTLRADHTSAYGYERQTTPNLERLASQGVLFESFFTHSNWTQPSVASLLSGTYPLVFQREFDRKLPRELLTAAKWLGDSGYQTVGITVTAATSALFGFDEGYDQYLELDAHLELAAREKRENDVYLAQNVVNSALGWLDGPRRLAGQPFFLYLHTMDPHMPVKEHEGFTSFAPEYDGPLDGSVTGMSKAKRDGHVFTEADIAYVRGLYDSEVFYNDAWLGKFVDGLVERGLWENTILVIVSDHGEELFDRGSHGHGQANLHRELTSVPFVIVAPGRVPAGVRVERLVRGVDLLPTVLDIAGLDPLPAADGISVARAFDPTRAGPQLGAPGAVLVDRAKAIDDVVALRTIAELYVRSPGSERFPAFEQLFDLTSDRSETVDVSASRPAAVADHLDHLRAWKTMRNLREQKFAGGSVIELTAEMRAKLEALGYLDADAPHSGN